MKRRMRILRVNVTDDQFEFLRWLARTYGLDISEVVRAMISSYKSFIEAFTASICKMVSEGKIDIEKLGLGAKAELDRLMFLHEKLKEAYAKKG